MDKENVHAKYHDTEYSFPIEHDNLLFERLILVINKAGPSWTTILNKKDNFFRAYDEFISEKTSRYSDKKIGALLLDVGIISNLLKVEAAVHNAKMIEGLLNEFGTFKKWLDHYHPRSNGECVKLKSISN